MASTVIYLTHDNPLDWVLTSTNSAGDITYINAVDFDRFVVDLGDTELDSDDTGFGTTEIFDVSTPVVVGETTVVPLRLRLGLADVTAGSYKARLIGYNTDYPDGLVWKNKIPLKFIV